MRILPALEGPAVDYLQPGLHCGADIAIERLQHQPDAVVCMPCLSGKAAPHGR